MKHRILAILLILSILMIELSACGAPGNTDPTQPDGKRTLFIYLCGSNLETKQGLASKNITELLSANVGDNLNIVIQTGGTKTWRSRSISHSSVQRYEVKNGELILLDTLAQKNMGEAETLTDFLNWGQEQYPSAHNMLILWNHGAGAVSGLCFDENYGFDAITLNELHSALQNAKLKEKLEIIGFDACLMASIETAVKVQDFAAYMIASEEIEPSGGWDYKALAEACANETDPCMVGKLICESYMEKCKTKGSERYATLSLFDLSLTDKMLEQFERAVGIITLALTDKHTSSEMIHGLKNCEKFGVSQTESGSANMLDLLDIFNQTPNIGTEDMGGELTDLYQTVHDFVAYHVKDYSRHNYGLSFFYPFDYDEKEIRDYLSLGISENYNKFLNSFYLNLSDVTVQFTDKGRITDSGAFAVTIDINSIGYLTSVDYILIHTDQSGVRHLLCTDNDILSNLGRFVYHSNFSGICHTLNGHRLFYVATYRYEEYGEVMVDYSAPIIVNGTRTTLHYVYTRNEADGNLGSYIIYGIWSGYDENGMPIMDYSDFNEGDRVQVVTDVILENGKRKEVLSEEFTIQENGAAITAVELEDTTYQYVFVATDLFDNTFMSDMATFERKDGAYTVTKIEPCDISAMG